MSVNNGLPFRVIEGEKVDLISPFPEKEIGRLYGWLRRVRTELGSDGSPKGRKETIAFYSQGLKSPNITSYAIVDKGNITSGKTDTPLVGFIAFEGQGGLNGYLHIALTKKANDERLIDESIGLAVRELFERFPSLLRISAIAAQSNWLVREIADRVGFRTEGVCEDFYTYKGEPRNVVHYGLTRRIFNNKCRSLHQQSDQSPQDSGHSLGLQVEPLPQQTSPEPLAEPPLEPLVAVEDKADRPKPGVPLPLET